MGFLVCRNDKYSDWDEEDGPFERRGEEGICWEILNTKLIMHVYVRLPDKTSLCIEYLNKRGGYFELNETFNSEGECLRRFTEIGKKLEEEN